jgi:putative FmdB family regulatory protein
MPLYEFKCEAGHVFDEFLKLDEYDNPMTCECGKPAKRQITATMVNFDIPNWDRYISPSTGKLITSYKDRKQDMKDSGCIDYDPGMKANAARIRKAKEAALDKKIDETVERQISVMSSDQRDSLAKELTTKDISIENH